MQGVEFVAIETVLQFWHLKVVQTFELDVGVGECLAPLGLVGGDKIECRSMGYGIDYKLSIVTSCHLRSIASHEAGRRTTDKGRDALHFIVLLQNMAHRIGKLLCLVDSLPLGKENLYSKLITVCEGKDAYFQHQHE